MRAIVQQKLGLGSNISENYKRAIDITTNVIIDPKQFKKDGQITVVPLETGGGKSSITNITLAWLAEHRHDECGTIILKERIEDCDRTVADINGLAGTNITTAYHSKIGKNSEYGKSDAIRTLFRYPILVMTHEGFKKRMKKLGDFIYWSDDKVAIEMQRANHCLTRTRLIVDEQPTLMDTYQITNKRLNVVCEYVQRLGNRDYVRQLGKMCDEIRENCFLRRVDLETQFWYKCNHTFSRPLEDAMYKSRSEEVRNTFSALKILCDEGGFVNYSDNDEYRNITVARYIDIFDPLFDSIVLDGTGRINAVYNNDNFNIVDMPQIKSYENTTVMVCKQLSGSRAEISNNNDILGASVEYVSKMVPSGEKCLVVTHKEFEPFYSSVEHPGNVSVNHFGNITGSNEYREYKYGFYIGTPFMYDNAYKLAYHIYSKDKDYTKPHGAVTIRGVRRLVDKDYNKTKVAIIAVEMIQAINRLRCRNWVDGGTAETFSFLLNKDDEVLDLIKQGMPGVKIVYDDEFYSMLPEIVRQKKPEYSIDILLRVIQRYRDTGAKRKVTKGELLAKNEKLHKLTNKSRAELWSHPHMQQLINDGIISISGRTIEFLEVN